MAKFSIRAEHFVKPGRMDEWLALARANSQASLLEPGCERFDILIARDDPNHALLYEIYISREAWLEHQEQPHFKTFVSGIQELIERRVRGEFDLLL